MVGPWSPPGSMALGGAEFTPVAICGSKEGELCIMPEKGIVLSSDCDV